MQAEGPALRHIHDGKVMAFAGYRDHFCLVTDVGLALEVDFPHAQPALAR